MSSIFRFVILIIFFASITIQCKDDDTESSGPAISIEVKDVERSKGIVAAIFINDSLYGDCDKDGIFKLEKLDPGKYELICSAQYFRDTAISFTIEENKPVKLEFKLAVDSSIGRVYGEFQDLQLYKNSISQKPEIDTWDEKKKFDASTGATLFYKNFEDSIPPRLIILNQDTIAIADGFAQYWFKIQSGTYQIEARCSGYKSSKTIVTVKPNSKNYKNFYLEKN